MDGSQDGLSNEDFQSLMEGTFGPDTSATDQPISTETAQPEAIASAPQEPQVLDAATVAPEAVPETVEATTDPESPTGDPATTDDEAPDLWESDDNPYRQQAIDLAQRTQAAQQVLALIQTNQQRQKIEQVIEALPTMDEDQQKTVMRNLLALQAQQAQQTQQQIAQENFQLKEEKAKNTFLRVVSERNQLTKEERVQLAQFSDADAGEAWAKAISANRRAYNGQIDQMKTEIANLKAAQMAQQRIESGVDNVGGPATAGVGAGNPEDATDFDSFFTGWVDNPAYVRGR